MGPTLYFIKQFPAVVPDHLLLKEYACPQGTVFILENTRDGSRTVHMLGSSRQVTLTAEEYKQHCRVVNGKHRPTTSLVDLLL